MATELEVLRAAREQIAKGYTDNGYVTVGRRSGGVEYHEDVASAAELRDAEKSGAPVYTCAIGGVEHAIFKLTKKLVAESQREIYAYPDGYNGKHTKPRAAHVNLYWQVMNRLNDTAIRAGWTHLEVPNVELPPSESKPIVLRIYDNAIRQAERAEKRELVTA